MSTLRCTNLQDTSGANSSTTAQIASGRAKAWVNFNGNGTVAIRTSFNVSSITDNNVGTYTVNFTTAFSDADYVAFCWDNNDGAGWFNANMTTTTMHIVRVNNSWTATDNPYIHYVAFR